MTVRDTSIEAFKQVDLNAQERIILIAISEFLTAGGCIADVAAHLGMQRSTVAARMNHLKKLGEIYFIGKKPSATTGITAEHYRVKDPKGQQKFAFAGQGC